MLHSPDHNHALPEPIGALHGPSQLVPVAFEHTMIGMATQVSTRTVHCTDARKSTTVHRRRRPSPDSCACPSIHLISRTPPDTPVRALVDYRDDATPTSPSAVTQNARATRPNHPIPLYPEASMTHAMTY